MATIEQILRMSEENRKEAYKASDISYVIIDGNTFTNYSAFSFIWEKSYVKSPERSSDGTIGNLNSYATFIVPHLKIDFSMLSIDDYRILMKLIYSKNEFIVTCYDVVNNKPTTNKMYFATEEMPKLWAIARAINGEEWVELLGVQDYTIELIGTNSPFDFVNVVYHFNPPEGSGLADKTESEEDVYKGEEIIIGANSTFKNNAPQGYKFKHWIDNNNAIYVDGYAYTINEDLVLYAVWAKTDSHTLNFNYGLSAPMIDPVTMTYKQSITVVKGQSIGILPTFETSPSVTVDGNKYEPYYDGAWWKVPTRPNIDDERYEELKVDDNELYWSDYDSTIYLLYITRKYTVNYYLDAALYSTNSIEYNVSIPLPQLVKDGYTFSGWFIDSNYKNHAPTTMPPYPITLYAKFISNTETPTGTYPISVNIKNGTASANNPSTIEANGTATLVFTANENYILPDSITVIGAISSWNSSTGTLVLSNPTGAVTVIIDCILELPEPTLQRKSVTPSTSLQKVVADDGFDGLSEVTVSAVTSNIDSNITAENIKNGVSILGVTGTLESSGGIEDVATAEEMTALLVADNVGKVYRFTGTTDSNYTNGDLYEVVSE